MKRTDVLRGLFASTLSVSTASSARASASDPSTIANLGKPLAPPKHGSINVACVIGPDVVPIDVVGPLTVLGSASMVSANGGFNIYTVARAKEPIDIGGMAWQPDYTFHNAPRPNVLIVPQQKRLPETIEYVRNAARETDVTASICTGAFLVAEAGLFDGGRATTHHDAYNRFAQLYPKVRLIRGVRYVEDANVSSSGGETSGIDLALRLVERYYGRSASDAIAYSMEYRRTARPRSESDV